MRVFILESAAVSKICTYSTAFDANCARDLDTTVRYKHSAEELLLGPPWLPVVSTTSLTVPVTDDSDPLYRHILSLSPLNMLDGYEYRLAYCAAFGSMTFDLASLLWNQFGKFSCFGFLFKDDPVVQEYPALRSE